MVVLAKLVVTEENSTDSKELLDVFLGISDEGRDSLIIEATTRTALRKGDWLMIPAYKGKALNKHVNIEVGNSPEPLLYNLKEDIAQQYNLASENPEKLKELMDAFIELRGADYTKTQKLELK
ncbi:hypothetical protein [Saccharicrinis sp. 156]|uniref:hypothetical protein n=1 Tax=Saccharicrinis sp. 156 TaxID=3417574 RepID=UPI003D32D2AF